MYHGIIWHDYSTLLRTPAVRSDLLSDRLVCGSGEEQGWNIEERGRDRPSSRTTSRVCALDKVYNRNIQICFFSQTDTDVHIRDCGRPPFKIQPRFVLGAENQIDTARHSNDVFPFAASHSARDRFRWLTLVISVRIDPPLNSLDFISNKSFREISSRNKSYSRNMSEFPWLFVDWSLGDQDWRRKCRESLF